MLHKARVINKVAVEDTLSREHEEGELKTIAYYPIWQQGRDIQTKILNDPLIKKISFMICKRISKPDQGTLLREECYIRQTDWPSRQLHR